MKKRVVLIFILFFVIFVLISAGFVSAGCFVRHLNTEPGYQSICTEFGSPPTEGEEFEKCNEPGWICGFIDECNCPDGKIKFSSCTFNYREHYSDELFVGKWNGILVDENGWLLEDYATKGIKADIDKCSDIDGNENITYGACPNVGQEKCNSENNWAKLGPDAFLRFSSDSSNVLVKCSWDDAFTGEEYKQGCTIAHDEEKELTSNLGNNKTFHIRTYHEMKNPCPESMDFGKTSFRIEDTVLAVLKGSVTYRTSEITAKFNPEYPFCGSPEFTSITSVKGEGLFRETWIKKILEGDEKTMGLRERISKLPGYTPDLLPSGDDIKEIHSINIHAKLEKNIFSLEIYWNGNKKKSVSRTVSRKKAVNLAVNAGNRHPPSVEDRPAKIIYYETDFNSQLLRSLQDCCEGQQSSPDKSDAENGEANKKISSPSTYLVRKKEFLDDWDIDGSYIIDGYVYYFGPSNVVFNKYVNVTLRYNSTTIPDSSSPKFYRYEDDYIDLKCDYEDSENLSFIIDSEGGTITSSDENFIIKIPQEALNQTTELFISKRDLNCGNLKAEIECSEEDDCGNDEYVSDFSCDESKMFLEGDYKMHSCQNPETYSSYCIEETFSKIDRICDLNETCENNGCVLLTCISDSDGGINPEIFGEIEVEEEISYLRRDSCVNEDKLVELYCNNNSKLQYDSISCSPDFCFNGKCQNISFDLKDILSLTNQWTNNEKELTEILDAIEIWKKT